MELRPGYKQTEIGVLPSDWEIVAFGGIVGTCIDYRGRTPRKLGMDWGGGDVLALSANNVQMGRIAPEKEAYFGSEELYRKWMRQGECAKGDVLLTMEAPLGNVAQIPDSQKYILSQRVILIKPNARIDRDFLFHLLQGAPFQELLEQNSTGSTAKGIQRTKLEKLEISFPKNASEQSAIATALGDADALLAAQDALIAKKRAIKQGAIQELLTGKRRLPGFSGEWETMRLGELAKIQRGASPRPIDSPIWFDENSSVGWVRISDLTSSGMFLEQTTQKLSSAGISHSRPVERGSLVMSICATVGRPIITAIDVCIHDGFVVFGDLRANKTFIYYVLKWIEPKWSMHGQTGSQMNLNTGLINSTEIALPPIEEQTHIAEVMSDMDAELTALEAQRAKVAQLKQGMMQALLTGGIRLV